MKWKGMGITRDAEGFMVADKQSSIALINSGLRQILEVSRGERRMNYEYDGAIPDLLFEPEIPAIHQDKINTAIDAIHKYDPRIVIKNMDINTVDGSEHTLAVKVEWYIRTQSELAGSLEFVIGEEL